MIELKNVSKRYGSRWAVRGLSFSVKEGEILGFLGPNGAGKTTTLRIITGYMPPTEGEVRVAGFDPVERPIEVKRRIGYLPENPPLYDDMTVKSYLQFVAEIKEIEPRRRRREISKAMELVNISDVGHRLIGNLSRGYKQRVGLAQALLGDPQVLVLDEPTVGLDPKQIIEIRNLVKSLAGSKTIILSSHILPEVSMTCDRVVIINNGSLVAQDRPENLSRELVKAQQLHVVIKGQHAEVVQALKSIPGIKDVQLVQRSEDEVLSGVQAYRLATLPGEDVRERLFYAMAEKRFPIIELKSLELSLEDVFLNLVTEEKLDASLQVG